MIIDNFPDEGYSVVESIDPDPDAMWELSAYDDPPEMRPMSYLVTLSAADPDEAEAAIQRSKDLEAEWAAERPKSWWQKVFS